METGRGEKLLGDKTHVIIFPKNDWAETPDAVGGAGNGSIETVKSMYYFEIESEILAKILFSKDPCYSPY